MHENGKAAQELCGAFITHSLARLSKTTPVLPLGCLNAPWQSGAIDHFGEQEGIHSRTQCSKQKTARRLGSDLHSFFLQFRLTMQ